MQSNNNHLIQLFKQVLATGAKLNDGHIDQLQALLSSFPQSGLLHAIQARTGAAAHIQEAAAWFADSSLLQKVVLEPHVFMPVNSTQVIIKTLKPKPQPQQEEGPVVMVEKPGFEAYYAVIEEQEQSTEKEAKPDPEVVNDSDKQFGRPVYKEELFDETQKLIIENLAANDYFVFDKAFADRNKANHDDEYVAPKQEPIDKPSPSPTANAARPVSEEGSITRYHDDKMPYSFMWWLDKTRNKHSGIYRPFARPEATTPKAEPGVETGYKEVADDRRKEEEIVERFIQEEPSPVVRPPSGDKLDNENKAKQSAEDQEELITETLARIYADQTLYAKAIAAYKILILKNPEKRRYFASQIESLQKKIN